MKTTTIDNQQPTTDNRQPTTDNRQPTTDNRHHRREKSRSGIPSPFIHHRNWNSDSWNRNSGSLEKELGQFFSGFEIGLYSYNEGKNGSASTSIGGVCVRSYKMPAIRSYKMPAIGLEVLWVTLLLYFWRGKASAPAQVFRGEECFPSCVSPIPECPIGDACGSNSTCFMWKSGKLVNLVPTERAEQRLRLLPKPCYARSYASNDSFFVNDSWTHGSCALTHYSPIESDLLLRGHSIVFYGDSLLRQLFNRFVWHLRGIPNVLEQYYHAHALYVRNNERDALHIGRDDHLGTVHYSLSAQGSKLVDNPTIQLVFIWEPRLEDPDHIDQQLALARRDFSDHSLVMGMNYWSEGDEFHHGLVPPQIKRFQDSSRYPNMKLFWYPTTSTKYAKRNAFYGSLVNGSNTWILPSEPMSVNAPYAHNRGDTIHFQCGINLKFPGKVENLDRLNTPETKDCRDMFDYNIMQYILNVIAERKALHS